MHPTAQYQLARAFARHDEDSEEVLLRRYVLRALLQLATVSRGLVQRELQLANVDYIIDDADFLTCKTKTKIIGIFVNISSPLLYIFNRHMNMRTPSTKSS